MSKVKDKKLISTYGNNILDGGFHSIPNMILDYQKQLNLTDKELLFFIKVTHFFKKKYITNNELNMESSRTTLTRIKLSLIKKGYLKTHILYNKREDGKIIGIGTKYDWSGLIEILNKMPMFQNEHASSKLASNNQNEQADTKMKHIKDVKECLDNECIEKEKEHQSQLQQKELTESFEIFWNLYDYKIGKPDCFYYWCGKKKLKNGKFLTIDDRFNIMGNITSYVKSTNKDGTYPSRKHPKTYLYNSSWNDEIVQQKQIKNKDEFTEDDFYAPMGF